MEGRADSAMTPEYQSFLEFIARSDPEHLPENIAQYSGSPRRLWRPTTGELAACLEGPGEPVIVQDALHDCPLHRWSWGSLVNEHGQTAVLANNRAPARHADDTPGGGGKQRTVVLPLETYVSRHVGFVDTGGAVCRRDAAPFYVNGWRLFSETSEPLPEPSFAAGVDQTAEIAAAVDAMLLGGDKGPDAATPAWIASMLAALTKLFLGPPGTITRLHYDAGDAHGWLAQVAGRKLFVLLPPTSSAHVHVLESETETVQSAVDPLAPSPAARWPRYAAAKPIACVLQPHEAIIVPRGWWHYAVALEPSITLQRNFYHAPTNAKGLVAMVLKTAKALKTAGGGSGAA